MMVSKSRGRVRKSMGGGALARVGLDVKGEKAATLVNCVTNAVASI